MDNWLALFDGQTRYFLDIFDSSVKPDVLRFRGREALVSRSGGILSSPACRRTSPGTGADEICHLPDTKRQKCLRQCDPHGMAVHIRGTSLTTGLRSVRAWRCWDTPGSARYIRTSPFRRWLSRCCADTGWRDLILTSAWSAPTRRVKLSPSGGKRTLSLSGAFCLRWGFTGERRWMTCAVWIYTFLPTASLTTGLTCACRTASHRACLTAQWNRSGMCGLAQGCHRYRRHTGLQLPDRHHADGCRGLRAS